MSLAARLRRPALRVFGQLPRPVRRAVVRGGTTTYTLGCLAVLRRGEDVLLLEQAHLPGLSLPGGLLRRGETPQECVQREVREELGLELAFGAQPDGVVVDARARRVDLVFAVDVEGDVLHGVLQGGDASDVGDGEVQRARWAPAATADGSAATARALRSVLPR